MNKYLILQWRRSEYDSLNHIMQIAARELAAIGWHGTMLPIDGDGQITKDQVSEFVSFIKSENFSFAIAISGIGSYLWTPDGELFWDTVKIPCFAWFCDHPAYMPSRHIVSSNYLLHGYVFPDHARFHHRHLNSNGVSFAAHLGVPTRSLFCGNPKPLSQRNGRILYAKSGGSLNKKQDVWKRNLPEPVIEIILNSAEELFDKSCLSMPDIITSIAERHNIFVNPNGKFMMSLMLEIDDYVRIKQSIMVAEAIKPYPVDIYGAGWEHFDAEGGRACYNGQLYFGTMIEHLPNYLANLSTNPMVEESVHDRVFFALAAGVTPISATNRFIMQEMPNLNKYTFEYNKDSIIQAVESVLEDPQASLEETEIAHNAVFDKYSMIKSLKDIVSFCSLRRFNCHAE